MVIKNAQNKASNVDLGEMNMENKRKTQKAKFQPTPVEKHNFYWEYQRILVEDD